MSVIISNGQSFDQIAAEYTLSPAYGPCIAAHNNMTDDITGKRYWVEIPDGWMKPEYAGKKITLAKTDSPGIPTWAIAGAVIGLLLLTK